MEHQKVLDIKTRIVSDPKICGGEPCIKDTRIPVYVILSHLAAGEDFDTVLKNFPRLKYEDIIACLEYAAYLATEKAIYSGLGFRPFLKHEYCDKPLIRSKALE